MEDALLTARLEEVLKQIADPAFATRLRKVYVAAANAIGHLGDMDLVKYETASVEGGPDLSLWEEMAPVIRDTVMDVNGLLSVAREEFPGEPAGGLAETLTRAIEQSGQGLPPGSREARRRQQVEAAIQAITQQIAQEVTHLGERMRSPSVVSDRWNLLTDLQTFRGKFRSLIGDLVLSTATAFAEVHAKEVVPGYQEELKSAISMRATLTDMARVVRARLQQVREAEPEDLQWNAQQFEKELDTFGRTAAYKSLRAQDKRTVVELRPQLGKVAIRTNPAKSSLLALVEPFEQMIGALMRVNNREVLIAHDREVWASCGVRIEQAEQLLAGDSAAAGRVLGEAAALAQGLYGRDPALDVFLRKAKKSPLAALSGEVLRQELNKFRELLANLPIGGL